MWMLSVLLLSFLFSSFVGVLSGDGERVTIFCVCHEKKLVSGMTGGGVGSFAWACHSDDFGLGVGIGDIAGEEEGVGLIIGVVGVIGVGLGSGWRERWLGERPGDCRKLFRSMRGPT